MVQGAPTTELQVVTANPFLQAALDAELDQEVEDLASDFENFTLNPMLSFGVVYPA